MNIDRLAWSDPPKVRPKGEATGEKSPNRSVFQQAVKNCLRWYLIRAQFLINIRMTKDKIKKYSHLFSGKLLDIGAGRKPYRFLFSQVDEYIGTNAISYYDNSPDKGEVGRCTDLWVSDGTQLPFKKENFDDVVSFQVLSIIRQPDLFIKEASRVLRPGGMLMITTDFIYPKWDLKDAVRHTDTNLRLLGIENGFDVLAVESYGGFWTMYYSLFLRYVRSYPGILKAKKSLAVRMLCGLVYSSILVSQPLISLCGCVVYVLERNLTSEFDYTMNNLLVARKKG